MPRLLENLPQCDISQNDLDKIKIFLMKLKISVLISFVFANMLLCQAQQDKANLIQFPQNNATNVNPDTHLVLTFSETPILGQSGKVRIYDASNNKLVDSLDLSIPVGPTVRDTTKVGYTPKPYEYISGHFTNANTKPGTPSGVALPTSNKYQLTIIGGFTDAFHFYPVIIHRNVATIYPHNNLLDYNKNYFVTIDSKVFSLPSDSFKGIRGSSSWTFSTKKTAPANGQTKLVVNANGSGDFNTVQGALDFIPENNQQPITIFIKKGIYEEIVYFRKKSNITFVGEDREKTIVCYQNNEVFNPHPANIGTNELRGTFPSRRAAVAADNCNNITFCNLTLMTTAKGQAEGLLLTGEHNMLYKVNIKGWGDALQVNGSAYIKDSKIEGNGDMILGRGAAFFDSCEFHSRGAFMWIRNSQDNHGNVFLSCTFQGTGKELTEIAREPINRGKTYPYSEAVLINCRLGGISSEGWGEIDGETTNIHYWEYNSTNLSDGKLIDASLRHPASKQLNMEKDATTIANYSNPPFVLGGWNPPIKDLTKIFSVK